MANEKTVITVNLDMFDKDADAKTAEANKVAKNLGISDEALAKVENFKQELTDHDAWDLPFMGYVNEDGYGYAYVPDAAITMHPYWDAHKEFMNLPDDVQTAFAIRMLFTHRPVDRYGADMFTAPTCSCITTADSPSTSLAKAPTNTDRLKHRLLQLKPAAARAPSAGFPNSLKSQATP